MQAHQLRPARGATHSRKRIGRGDATGQGTYAGKGIKGQKARSGNDLRIGFEGGQLPLIKRMGRKRGFTNIFRVEYQPVNLGRLAAFAAKAEVSPDALRQAGILKHLRQPVKILGNGEIDRPLTVRAHRFSTEARRKIEAAGGTVEEITDAGSR
ncbi:MAG: 50S ribosomal protein L15 [Dehalococcoidia bacterium]|nr:50S ribosomal protein L15 [Dehalococcoidia bacterium]